MDRIDEGISLFIFGLAKKVLLADGISALWYDVIGHDVNGVWAVSYTHLPAYLAINTLSPTLTVISTWLPSTRPPGPTATTSHTWGFSLAEPVRTVSYTHLDVYKRQTVERMLAAPYSGCKYAFCCCI